jgi:hypothetical protein
VSTLRSVYAGQWSGKLDIDLGDELLHRIGKVLISTLIAEIKADFAKRGWSLKRAPREGADPTKPIKRPLALNKAFWYEITGERTVTIKSNFWGIVQLTKSNIPSRKMPWLTQEAKKQHPERYRITPSERRRGRIGRGNRLPLIVPLKGRNGQIIFRSAPMKMSDAWIHPGIAKFTFLPRAIAKAKQRIFQLVRNELIAQIHASVKKGLRK